MQHSVAKKLQQKTSFNKKAQERLPSLHYLSCWICPLLLIRSTTRSSCQPYSERASQEPHSSGLSLTSQIGPSRYLGEVRYPSADVITRITSALFLYDKRTLLDIGHRCTILLQDTLSTDPAWPVEILRNTDVNKGRLNNPRRRKKKHHGRRAGIRDRLRKKAHSPPLPSILLANVQSLENKMDDLRARISFQRDIRDCNILCLTETWLTPSVPDTAAAPSDNFSAKNTT